jgi:hypothetical protein
MARAWRLLRTFLLGDLRPVIQRAEADALLWDSRW